jgi:hypothetical protein
LRISASSGLTISVGPARAQERGRDEVDGRLAPAGALDAEHARTVLHEVGDRLALVDAKAGFRPGQPGEQVVGGHLISP